jgi:hypothetical protein
MAWDDCFTERDYDHYMGYDNPDNDEPEEPEPAPEDDSPKLTDEQEREFAAYEWAVEHGTYHGPAPKGYR